MQEVFRPLFCISNMNKKLKIEIVILGFFLLILLSVIFLIYRLQPRDVDLSEISEGNLLDQIEWDGVNNYQLSLIPTGTEIKHYPSNFTMSISDDWIVETTEVEEGLDQAIVHARLRNSSFDANQIIIKGCSFDLGFTQSPLRWQSTQETIDILKNKSNDSQSLQVIANESINGLHQEYHAQNEHLFTDLIILSDNYYLLEISAIFSKDYQGRCTELLYQSLDSIEIN